jgi:antirestriction protein ArdC
MNAIDIFQKVETKIIDKLEQKVIPWEKPFNLNTCPVNGKTGRHYSGVNEFLLRLFFDGDPYFVGFRQAQDLGGYIKNGKSGFPIMFPIVNYYDTETGGRVGKKEANERPEAINKSVHFSYSYVFHLSQTEGIDPEKLPSLSGNPKLVFEPINQCENLLDLWGDCPDIRREGTQAFYHLKDDYINIPKSQYFTSEEKVYATIFHEAIHATGNTQRLDREKPGHFGDKRYSLEELIAEFGSAYLCGFAGIEKQTIENKSAYIQHWLEALKNDSPGDWIVKASSRAQEAADYIISGGKKAGQARKAS